VRPKVTSFALLFALAVGVSTAAAQDFDPNGRHRPGPNAHPPAHPPPHPTPPQAAAPPKPSEGVSPTILLERYTKVVLAQPGAPFPLQRLAQLYRDKDGSLDALVADFQKRAAQPGPEQYGAAVALAGIDKLDGRPDDAVRAYHAAIALQPTDPTAPLALAHLLQDRGEAEEARSLYEGVLKHQTLTVDREQTLRILMGLALDRKDWDAAKEAHAQIVKLEPSSHFVKGELGRELFARGEYERAEVELKELVAATAGDNRALAPALADLGKAQAKAHKSQEALATLKHALAAAGPEAAVRASIYQTITEVYRADERLGELIKELEGEHPSDYARLALLGSLYEETGDAAHAITTYRKALEQNGRNIDLRLKVVRLLQSQGELDRAIAEYEGLVRTAPNNAMFVFEMCDALIQRGDRTRALHLLNDLEGRSNGDEEVLGRLGEFYARIGESALSLKVLTRLTEVGGTDPSHLVDLGDHYYQEGNTALAVSTWKRMLTTVTPKARALAALGDVYLEHEMVADAIVALREAVGLDGANLGYKKALASALEHAKNYREAQLDWLELGHKAKEKGDLALAREARTHLVTLWGLERALEPQVAPLTTAFGRDPPDLDAGRTLAEVLAHLRRLPETETTLRRLVSLAPGDADSYLALERVLVQEGKVGDAIATLERLVVVDPKRARERYQRMAQYALQIYKDDDAIKYAARAVELNPEDAEGHRRLGEMYRSRQDTERAIREFRAAIAKNDRLYIVYFELADLLLSKSETDEADRLFRRVMRGATDEELVARAARLSLQINLGKGTLESLEQDLLPLAIDNPQKTIYRRLLVEIYESLTFALVQRTMHGTGKDADLARLALTRVGQRAVKPLLDTLATGDEGQERVAIDVLSYVRNKNAAPALFSFATGTADTPLRVRAMIACGALGAPELLPRYARYLFPPSTAAGADEGSPSDTVAIAASWAVARMGDKAATPLLRELAKHGNAEMRALGVLGLAILRDRASILDVASLAKSPDSLNVSRAAAAYALGELGAYSEVPTLVTLAEGTDALPREMALVALSRLEAGRTPTRPVVAAMADAVFAAGPPEGERSRNTRGAVRAAGAHALMSLAKGNSGARGTALVVPEGPLDVEAELEHLASENFSAEDRARALVTFEEAIEKAAVSAVETSSGGAVAVMDALGDGDGTLLPFVGPGDASPAARAAAERVMQAVESSLANLAKDPDPQMRSRAILLLGLSATDGAVAAVVSATRDTNEAVARTALSAIGKRFWPAAVEAVANVVAHHEHFPMRVLAAEALGRLGKAGAGAGAGEQAARALSLAATHDDFAIVREAALTALATFDPAGAQKLASEIVVTDPEPRMRESAQAVLRKGKP
jgi:tetratricopeptide (TPR) repeat protein